MDVSQLPFNRLIGLERADPSENLLISLPEDQKYLNHVGTVHAGALLAVAEAGSGELLVRTLGHLSGFVPIVRSVEAKFRRPASGRVSARSIATQETADAWASQLTSRGRCSASVPIEVVDSRGVVVLSAAVEWFISKDKTG